MPALQTSDKRGVCMRLMMDTGHKSAMFFYVPVCMFNFAFEANKHEAATRVKESAKILVKIIVNSKRECSGTPSFPYIICHRLSNIV